MKSSNRWAIICHLVFFFIMSISLAHPGYANKVEINGFVIDVTNEAIVVQDGAEKKDKIKDKNKKWFVQFIGPIHEAEKKQLMELDCRIDDYIPEFAFIVTMDDKTKKEVENFSFINGVAKYRPEHKIRKSFKEKIGRAQKQTGLKEKDVEEDINKIHIRLDSAAHLPLLLSAVHREKGKILDVGHDVATVKISAGAISQIAGLEEVIWIEEALDLHLMNDTSRWTIQTYIPDDTKIWDMGIQGEGQIIGIGDTGLDYDMPWFHDPDNIPIGPEHRKVIGYTAYMDDYDGDFGHGTHVACTVAGDRTPVDGFSEANGMAPKSRLFIQDITPGEQRSVYPPADLGLMFITPYSAGAHLHSNSWGAAVNIYETSARSTDRFMWEHKDFLALFSNGNSGDGEGSVGTPATSKNVVSVGATENGINAENLAGFSSNGPTADGRIKPTVTAPGVAIVSADSDGIKDSYNSGTVAYSGTSMATPTVAGAAALVRQYYLDGYWPYGAPDAAYGFEPSAALIKATLINSAQNMTGDYTDGPIPSTGQGWGRINLSNTLHFFTDNNFLDITDIPTGLSTGASWSQRYFSTGDQFLKVTLVWTDYPGFEGAAKTLVNDLDLLVTTPEGTTYTGNVLNNGISVTGGTADELNVVEQVFIPTLQSGDYTVTVTGYNVPFGPQPFAIVVTGAVSISSSGFIDLDKSRYNHEDTIQIQVADRDLNVYSSIAEEVNIFINSTSEPGGEVVQLVESGLNTSILTGSIQTLLGPAIVNNGYLEIVEGDIITATYLDADDGTGNPVIATATALADLTPPIISGITIDSLDQGSATVSWTTNEPVSAIIYYGEAPDNLGAFQSESWLLTSPVVHIGNLKENTTYYYKVSSTDEAGNICQDDNDGLLYSLTTLSLPPDLTVYSSNMTETYQAETVLYGTATDPSGIDSVRITGNDLDQDVECRPSDGYYELLVPLVIGENPFTVVATDILGNSHTLHITVTCFEQPDLVMTSVVAPASGGFAQPIHVENTVCNNGAGVSPGTGCIAWYLSPDTDISPSEDIKLDLEYYYLDEIPPGECISIPVDIRLAIPWSLVSNTYYLATYVDSNGDVWESDETNNILIAGNQMTIEGPDLAMTTLSGPMNVKAGTSFTIFNTVQNIGIGTSPPFEVMIYLSTDAVITMNDIEIGDRHVYPLEPVGTPYAYPSESCDDTEVFVRSTVSDGTYYIGAIADPGDNFYESDKENNVLLGSQIQVGCSADDDCDDGIFCNGLETCVNGSCQEATPVTCADDGLFCNGNEVCSEAAHGCESTGDPCGDTAVCSDSLDACVACLTDADCDDGQFCNGLEICDANGACQTGTPVVVDDGVSCTDDSCDEVNDVVVNNLNNGNCDDGQFCNGAETCDAQNGCVAGSDPCAGGLCSDSLDQCDSLCGDGVCDPGENCSICPDDCISGASGGTTCDSCFKGKCDGICHPIKDGADCSDCWSNYCCGDSVCEGEEDSINCSVDCPVTVCGDGVCDRDEDQCNCSSDCGFPGEEMCNNGIDDDCDDAIDCDDSYCAADSSCICLAKGESCQSASDCCSGRCKNGKCR